jgi:protein SCO1/2
VSAPTEIAATATAAATTFRPARGVSGRRLLLGLLAVLLLAVVPSVVAPTLWCRAGTPDLPDLGVVPSFALVDDHGDPFTEEALRGHPTIVSFVFTRCDTICPGLTGTMRQLQQKTSDRRGLAIKLLSISVDPEHDTPARLREYARRFGADPTRWRFLTGSRALVHALVEGPFMSSMQREGVTASGAPAISHSGYLALVDGDLTIRGVYDSSDVQRLDDLLHHARFLARTQRSYKFGGP